MNPARHAVTPEERLARARMIARTLPTAAAIGYMRRHGIRRVDQLQIILQVKRERGTQSAAMMMRCLGWSIEAALLTLAGVGALERYLYRDAYAV